MITAAAEDDEVDVQGDGVKRRKLGDDAGAAPLVKVQ